MTEEKFTPAHWSKNNTQANIDLIAVAPEMYEALKDLCDAIQEGDIQTISDRALNGIEILKKQEVSNGNSYMLPKQD